MAVMRILDVKSGPFHEHSSQLHSIAAGVPNWGKVNSGLFKMYQASTLLTTVCCNITQHSMLQAEVLGKRVVVQHIPLGGLLEWERKEGGDALDFKHASTSLNRSDRLSNLPSRSLPFLGK